MTAYQHILAAIDLDAHGEQVLNKARLLAQGFEARLCVLHVVDFVPLDSGDALMIATPDLNRQMLEQARQQAEAICAKCQIPTSALEVVQGTPAGEIKRIAQSKPVDLIVIGHHPRRGLATLLSHTDEHVVQRAPCDVLAVRLHD